MQFSQILSVLALAAAATAATVNLSERSHGGDVNCDGSGLCGLISKDCEDAFRQIDQRDYYEAGGKNTGVHSGHCGIFIQGSKPDGKCSISGRDLADAFQDIRSHGCKICGSEKFDDGCEATINYVS